MVDNSLDELYDLLLEVLNNCQTFFSVFKYQKDSLYNFYFYLKVQSPNIQ